MFFFTAPSTTELYTLSLHDALPISFSPDLIHYQGFHLWFDLALAAWRRYPLVLDRKSTRLNSSHRCISYAVFCLKKKKRHELRNKFRHQNLVDLSDARGNARESLDV